MLGVQFNVQTTKDCKSLVLTDTTPIGSESGYGGGNTPLLGVSKVRLIINTQDGTSFELSRGPLGADRQWIIKASDFGQGEPVSDNADAEDCGCCGQFMGNVFYSSFLPYGYYSMPCHDDELKNKFPDKFEDMCYTITYEAYSKTHIPASTANYSLSIKRCEDRFVFARVNGAWYDITGELGKTTTTWTFLKNNTNLRYDRYEVRDQADNVYSEGVFSVTNVIAQAGFVTSEDHVMVSAKTVNIPMLCVLSNRLEQAMYKIRMEPHYLINDVDESQALGLWALSYARLQAMIISPGCGCDEAMETSAQIRELLVYLFGTEPQYTDCDAC